MRKKKEREDKRRMEAEQERRATESAKPKKPWELSSAPPGRNQESSPPAEESKAPDFEYDTVRATVQVDMPHGGTIVAIDRVTGAEHRITVPAGAKRGDTCKIEVPVQTKTFSLRLPTTFPRGGLVEVNDRKTRRAVHIHVPKGAKKGDRCDLVMPVPPTGTTAALQ